MRQDAVLAIARALSAVTSRRVSVALGLWGEPGIGKTHAALEVLTGVPCHSLRLHATVSSVQFAAALPRSSALPGWVRTQLERAMEGETLGVAALVATLAASAPFVLHLEDLHEADPERRALIEALAGAVVKTRGVGLLVTSRAELPSGFVSHPLEPLSKEETEALMVRELKGEAPRDGLEWVFSRTRGNPLFALEFARYLRRQGFLWSDGERWHWREPPGGFMPVTVEALIAQFVTSMTISLEAHTALRARAILPSKLDSQRLKSTWGTVAGLDVGQLERAVGELERSGVLDDQRIVHPLIAETIARELSHLDRTRFARRALYALETFDPLLAVDYLGDVGLESPEVLEWLERSARALQTRGNASLAAHLLGLAAERAEDEDRVRLSLEALVIIGETSDYRMRERLARLALEAQPDNRQARLELGYVLAQRGEVAALNTLLEAIPRAERDELRWLDMQFRALSSAQRAAEALSLWNQYPQLTQQPHGRSIYYAIDAYCGVGELALAESLTTQTLERTDLLPRTRGLLLDSLAYIRSDQGHYDEAFELHNKAIALKRQDGHASNLASGLYDSAINLDRLGRLEDAEIAITESVELYDLAGNLRYGSNARAFRGHLLLQRGDFQRAEDALLEAYALSESLGNSINLVNCACTLALLYIEWRPPHGAALAWKFTRIALHAVEEMNQTLQISQVSSIAASVAAWQGEGDKAMAFATQARESLVAEATGEERYGGLVALARALEASPDQTRANQTRALEPWKEAQLCAVKLGLPLQVRESELEILRLSHDWQGVQRLTDWFEGQGRGLLAHRARRYLPEDTSVRNALLVSHARLNVLGPMTLERDGKPIPSRARKRLEILAYLLETRIAGRTEATALELLDALYSGESESEARHTLKQQVYLIRSSLGAESILSTSSGYALGAVSSDAEDFLRSGEAELWRGPYLTGLSEGWRSGVREALTLALHSSVQVRLSADPCEAARLGAVLCEMEPFDAGALLLGVRSLEATGDARAARRSFEQGRARLREVGQLLPQTLEEFVSTQVLT